MRERIAIGSTIVGATGKTLIVDRVEGDTIYSGELRIKISAVVQVIPPLAQSTEQVTDSPVEPNPTQRSTRFKIGGRVRFWGGLPAGSSTLTPTKRSIKLGLPIGYQLTIESIDGGLITATTNYGSFQLTADELEEIA